MNQKLGNYELIKRIAIGGMSEIFLAKKLGVPPTKENYVVVKKMFPQLALEPEFVENFHKEAKVASLMDHPNIVKLLDFGEDEGQFFLVMEYVDGMDLWHLIRLLNYRKERLSADVIVYIITELLSGLEHVHRLIRHSDEIVRIVHGDISPTNIYISKEGRVKLGDFGIAKIKKQGETFSSSRLKGKISYLSPEQVRGLPIDHRSDLFAVGSVMIELFLGEPLFSGNSPLEILMDIKNVNLIKIKQNLDKLPTGIEPILAKVFTLDPSERYESAYEFAKALSQLIKDTPRDLLRQKLSNIIIKLKKEIDTNAMENIRAQEQIQEKPTPIIPEDMYKFKTKDGREIGPVTYAKAVEMIVTGVLLGDEFVSKNNEKYKPILELEEFERHLNAPTPITKDMDFPTKPEKYGIIDSPYTLIQLIFELLDQKENGILLVKCGPIKKEVVFKGGQITYIYSNQASELLGEYLVRKKIITDIELNMALALMPRYGGKLGDTLIALDIIEPIQLYKHISEHLAERLLEMLTWKQGEYLFFKGINHLYEEKEQFVMDINPFAILYQGFLHSIEEEILKRWFEGKKDKYIYPLESKKITIDNFGFTTDIQITIKSLTAPLPFEEFISSSPFEEVEPSELLSAIMFLELIGYIKFQ